MIQSKMAGKITVGPPLALLALVLAIEALLAFLDLQVQYVEVWLVLAVVPVGLLLTQRAHQPKPLKKKIVDDDEDDEDAVPTNAPEVRSNASRMASSAARSR